MSVPRVAAPPVLSRDLHSRRTGASTALLPRIASPLSPVASNRRRGGRACLDRPAPSGAGGKTSDPSLSAVCRHLSAPGRNDSRRSAGLHDDTIRNRRRHSAAANKKPRWRTNRGLSRHRKVRLRRLPVIDRKAQPVAFVPAGMGAKRPRAREQTSRRYDGRSCPHSCDIRRCVGRALSMGGGVYHRRRLSQASVDATFRTSMTFPVG
jgi:hypothetical protein